MAQGNQGFMKNHWQNAWEIFLGAAFFTYTWSVLVFLYDFPALILRLSTKEIIVHLAYLFSFALFESFTIAIIFFAVSSMLVWRFGGKVAIIGNLSVIFACVGSLIYQFRETLWWSFSGADFSFAQVFGLSWWYLVHFLR